MPTETFKTNAPEVAAALGRLSARLADPAPALERARAVLAEQESEVWATQGSTLGVHWPPAVDADRKVDAQLLVASGALRASLADTRAGSVHGTTLVFGTDVAYGGYHQYGTSRMVARPFLGIAPSTERMIVERLAAAIAEAE